MSLITDTVGKLISPSIFIYAIYLILTGYSAPGGGFAGGVIISLGVLLYLFSRGSGLMGIETRYADYARIFSIFGIIGMGIVPMLEGLNFLENWLQMPLMIVLLNLFIGILVGSEFSILLSYLIGGKR